MNVNDLRVGGSPGSFYLYDINEMNTRRLQEQPPARRKLPEELISPPEVIGFEIQGTLCKCLFDHELVNQGCPAFTDADLSRRLQVETLPRECYKITFEEVFPPPPEELPPRDVSGTGDPHFTTWTKEHFEFHGQCDLVMTKVKNFAKGGLDLDIHLRTSMVRYWSYIKTAAIRIGDDILEVTGSPLKESGKNKLNYRINFEHLGELDTLGGFPVTINPNNDNYTIDLDSEFPGQKIEIKTFKEFVSVKVIGATKESFGNAVGITGDFVTGNTYARDGTTVLHDFNELGLEWQVLPSDGKLFHELARPQFPELCMLPEDPRGDRARRLAESEITMEVAEAACASLQDELDRKDCVYDILATQDLEMVGAF